MSEIRTHNLLITSLAITYLMIIDSWTITDLMMTEQNDW